MTDVSIVGGGLVGGVLSIALAEKGIQVAVIDKESQAAMLHSTVDGRTTAINYASQKFFLELGLWEKLASYAEPILDIKVFESGSPWSIHFDHKMLGGQPMGYITENRFIRQAIIERASSHPNISWYDETSLLTKKITQHGVGIYLSNGLEFKVDLLVGAEGRSSQTREEAGIRNYKVAYNQRALVFSVSHEKPHKGIAWEAFYPAGPLAFLPLQDCSDTGKHRSGVVWTLPEEEGNYWYVQENTIIETHLKKLFGFLGDFQINGQKWNYPLSAQVVDRFIDNRFAIIGDAAHVCHPVAGQGVNVGWQDAYLLAQHLGEAKKIGLDLGANVLLKNYQRSRRLDSWSIFAMTDGMVRLFSNNSSILYFLRNAGLGTVNKISPLKRFLMKRAMGIS